MTNGSMTPSTRRALVPLEQQFDYEDYRPLASNRTIHADEQRGEDPGPTNVYVRRLTMCTVDIFIL